MELDAEGRTKVLHSLLDIGEIFLSSGAEIKRVEDTLTRMGRSYGAERMNVFAINTSIVVTMVYPGEQEYTQTRRVQSSSDIDFTRIEELNALSRACCLDPLPPDELRRRIAAIREKILDRRLAYFGGAFGAGSFAIFFGGSLADGIAAAVFALPLVYMQRNLFPLTPNRLTFNMICSLIMGLLTGTVSRLIPFLSEDWIDIGDIMLLIPGLALTNAVRDVLVGDTLSGIMRLIESFLWAAALAGGFMIAFTILKGAGL